MDIIIKFLGATDTLLEWLSLWIWIKLTRGLAFVASVKAVRKDW